MSEHKNITVRKKLAEVALDLAETIKAIQRPDYDEDAVELFDRSDARHLKAIAKALQSTCVWASDEDGIYQTACGHSFYFDDSGTATDHKQAFCGYCGRVMDDVMHKNGGAK